SSTFAKVVPKSIPAPPAKVASCGWTSPLACLSAGLNILVGHVVDAVVWVFSWILYIANEIFSKILQISIKDFRNYATLDGVKKGWTIIRDLMNLGFIAGMFYLAIGTIL